MQGDAGHTDRASFLRPRFDLRLDRDKLRGIQGMWQCDVMARPTEGPVGLAT